MKNIAIFASGGGSNAEKIMEYFKANSIACVKFVVTNNANAGVINKAKKMGVPNFIISKNDLQQADSLIRFLKQNNIDLIVLAGFLLLIPNPLIAAFENKIINIHPSLLPKYGGKGMHGTHVHKAVYEAKEKESGISIHYVNEKYDEGNIIFQAKCTVEKNDTPDTIAEKVLALEHQHFAPTIEKILN